MNWTKNQIAYIMADLAEENPFACRALFKITDIVFTDKVQTLAVSLSSKPVLMINESFLSVYARSENDIKALLMHEFLHIILLHTEKYKHNTPLLNIALDAIINSIIHRTYGKKYSNFFCQFYKWEGVESILRRKRQIDEYLEEWYQIHTRLYEGKFAADDLFELLHYLAERGLINPVKQIILIGNHDFKNKNVSTENEKLLKEILSKMDGTGIWNEPGQRGIGISQDHERRAIEKLKVNKWKNSAFKILKQCLTEDLHYKHSAADSTVLMPVLTSTDRRALSSFSWSGIIPLAKNNFSRPQASETVNIYLDVSGSMNQELDQLIALLHYFRKQIKTPLWTFSNEVCKAVFKYGMLSYESTGGTSISCVFDHIRKNRFKKNMIVTDGYIESIDTTMLHSINKDKLWIILSADGDPSEFHKHGIKYFQLNKM